jgi:hypothetical protein
MAEPNESGREQPPPADLAAAARDRGMEQLEGVKGQLAEGAERVADAVDRTAADLEGEGDETVSAFGRSLSGLMRQLAGGLRERDIERFSAELAVLARRNPAVFLAGSVALGFGIARFFKARAPQARLSEDSRPRADSRLRADHGGERRGEPPLGTRGDFDGDESLDLSGNPPGVARRSEGDGQRADAPLGPVADSPSRGGSRGGQEP